MEHEENRRTEMKNFDDMRVLLLLLPPVHAPCLEMRQMKKLCLPRNRATTPACTYCQYYC